MDVDKFSEKPKLLSIVTAAFNEAENLPILYKRLCESLEPLQIEWEWVIIDDCSEDETYEVIKGLIKNDKRIRCARLARNSGSHKAILCGLSYVRGDCAISMAADLQDSPDTISALLEERKKGSHVVWAARRRRDEKQSYLAFAKLYYFLMRRIIGIKQIPPTGADFFLMDRVVIKALRRFRESNVSILVLITWMGYRQTSIFYDKQARVHGKSGWSFENKIKLVLDSITSFSYLPIRVMSYIGFVVAVMGFLATAAIVVNFLIERNVPEGWSSLMVVIVMLGGLQMLMMGILGEYIWRALDEARGRPLYLIESTENMSKK